MRLFTPLHLSALAAFALACAGPTGPTRLLIPKGSTVAAIADSLAAHQLIPFKLWFRLAARLGRYDRSLKPGLYAFGPGSSTISILRALRDGKYLTARLTVPEGFTIVDVADLVTAEMHVARDSVLAAARDTVLLHRYGVTAGSAEGYLAPDTYLIPAHYSARETLAIMLDQFSATWDSTWDTGLRASGLSRHQALTLASIVEGEARVDEERPVIAAVYLNRLRARMPLQADPTVQYAIQVRTGERKPRLYNADYRIESPYNTYLHPGLPPGPVGAPGRKSIEAVLQPARVAYLYFVAGPDGRHRFSRTYQEHLRTVAKVRRAR
jgi:UPF0755 protein